MSTDFITVPCSLDTAHAKRIASSRSQECTDEHYTRQVRQKNHSAADTSGAPPRTADTRRPTTPADTTDSKSMRQKTTETVRAAVETVHAEITAAAVAQHAQTCAAGIMRAMARADAVASRVSTSAVLPAASAPTLAAATVDYEASLRTRRGSRCRLDRLRADELLYLLERERADKSVVERECALAKIARTIAERRAAQAEANARALPSVRQELAQAQGELRGVQALRKRLELVEAGSAALRAAGLNDFLDGFARAIDTGKLVLTSIGAHRLSEWSRNILVAPTQRRYPGTRQFWSYVSKKKSGMTALEEICGDDDPRFQGEPTPSRDSVSTGRSRRRWEALMAVGSSTRGCVHSQSTYACSRRSYVSVGVRTLWQRRRSPHLRL